MAISTKSAKSHIRPHKMDSFLMTDEDSDNKLILVHPISRHNSCYATADTILQFFRDYYQNDSNFINVDVTQITITIWSNFKFKSVIECPMCAEFKINTKRNTEIDIKKIIERIERINEKLASDIKNIIIWRKNILLRNKEIKDKNAIDCIICLNAEGLDGIAYKVSDIHASYVTFWKSVFENNDVNNIYRCATCKGLFCNKCKHKYKDPNSIDYKNIELIHNRYSCDELISMKDKDPSEITIKILSQNCINPDCNVPIEKNGGCNHMTCRKCNTEFCFFCRQKWPCYTH